MSEICIISATNRKESKTYEIARIYQQVLKEKGVESEIFSLLELPPEFIFSDTFGHRTPAFDHILKNHIDNHQKFVLIAPEYNGSFPGILKAFLDAVHPRHWTEKKIALVGVSDGRAGNLRGLEHLTNILHHLKLHVYHFKVPVSQVNKVLDDPGGELYDETKKVLLRQAEGFLRFF